MDIEMYFDLKHNVADIPWENLSHAEIDAILEKRVAAFEARPSPKREGYVIERMAIMRNLRQADIDSQSGNKEKKNRHITEHKKHVEEDLRKLQYMILTLKLPPNNYHISQRKTDTGKVRDLIIQDYFPWRILPHALMLVIGPKLYKRLIYDSVACVKGKGLHFGVKRIKMMIRRYDVNYFWKADYKKYYQSIPHRLIIREFEKMFKDERFIQYMKAILITYESDIEDLLINEREKRRANRCI